MKHAKWPNEGMIANWPWNHNWRQPEEGSENILYEGEIRFSEDKSTISGSIWHDLMKWCKKFQYGTPKMKMQRANFDPWWKYADTYTNIGLIGDGNSLEVSRTP